MGEVLTIRDVAEILKLAEKIVYATANAGDPWVQDPGPVAHQENRVRRGLNAQPRGGDHPGQPPSNGEQPVGTARVHRNARPRRKAE